MAKGLTKRQQEILDFILEYVKQEGYPPSIREMGVRFDIGSLRGVTVHLDALERKGYISRSNTPRSIKVVHPEFQVDSKVTMLPVLGDIAAGTPIAAIETFDEMVAVPTEMIRGVDDPFLLRVRGESMIGDGIMPKDLVIIKPQATAVQNELVAVLVDEEATVKRMNFTKEGIFLMPSNPNYSPIAIEPGQQASVIGKVVGLLRDYRGRAF